MLTANDIAWIKANRAEIIAGRTVFVTAIYEDGSESGVEVVWKEPIGTSGEVARGGTAYGVSNNDYSVSFDENTPPDNIVYLRRGTGRYVLTDIDARGLGDVNRYECRAMQTTPGNETVRIFKGDGNDGWAQPIEQEPITVDAFCSEEINTVENELGEEVVSRLRIVFVGVQDVDYTDKIEYTDALGRVTKRKPERIIFRKRPDGRVLVTEVFV